MNEVAEQYKGVRGWLLLLCLSLTILDPLTILVALYSVSSAYRPRFEQYPALLKLIIASGVLRLALALFSVYSGLSLWRILPGAVATAQRYLKTIALYSVIAPFLPGVLGVPPELSGEMAPFSLFDSIITIAYAAAWYLYLRRSKRVRATYAAVEAGADRV